jgi:hypothetical protein
MRRTACTYVHPLPRFAYNTGPCGEASKGASQAARNPFVLAPWLTWLTLQSVSPTTASGTLHCHQLGCSPTPCQPITQHIGPMCSQGTAGVDHLSLCSLYHLPVTTCTPHACTCLNIWVVLQLLLLQLVSLMLANSSPELSSHLHKSSSELLQHQSCTGLRCHGCLFNFKTTCRAEQGVCRWSA